MLLREGGRNFIQQFWAPSLVILIAATLQMFLATRTIDFLITNILPDDAFYYFQIARHIVEGYGSTFDGINPTNGYHPLWMIVLIPVFTIASIFDLGLETPIRMALFLSILLNIGTGVAIYRILGYYTKKVSLRTLGLFVWSLNPFLLYESINGLETSLSLFIFSLFIFTILRFRENTTQIQMALIGLYGGLMILARIDLVFYFIAFLLWFMVTRGIRASIWPILICGATASLLVVPWLLWNLTQFGMFFTSASRGNELVNHTLVTLSNGTGLLQIVEAFFFHLHFHFKNILIYTGMPELVLIFFGALGVITLLNITHVRKIRKNIPIEFVYIGGFFLLFIADAGIRFTGRSWYFITFSFLVTLVVVALFSYVAERVAWRRGLVAGTLFFVSFSFLLTWDQNLQNRMTNQIAMRDAALWMNENISAGNLIGVFNAGITGYYSEHRVINLDGLVNNSAVTAMEERRLWSYIEEQHISYISDFEIYLSYRYHSFFDVEDPFVFLSPIHQLEVPEGKRGDVLTIYEVTK